MFRHPGEVVGAFMNVKQLGGFRIDHALKQTVYLMTMEDIDAEKYVFLVIDKDSKTLERYVQKGLSLDVKEDADCQFVLCGIGEPSPELLGRLADFHPRCTYVYAPNTQGLGARLCAACIDESPPNYCPLDVSDLREEFYGKEGSVEAEGHGQDIHPSAD